MYHDPCGEYKSEPLKIHDEVPFKYGRSIGVKEPKYFMEQLWSEPIHGSFGDAFIMGLLSGILLAMFRFLFSLL